MSKTTENTPERICILRMSAIGDICHTLPVIRSFQRSWPKAKLTWIIGKIEAGLIGDIEGIEFVIFDKKAGRDAYKKLRRDLAGRRFDLLLNMQASLRANRVSLHINARQKLGFDRARARDLQWLFTNSKIQARPRQHVLDGLRGFAEAFDIPVEPLVWDIPIPLEAQEFAIDTIPVGQYTLVISPCSSNRYRNWRNWSAEGYAAVIDHARQEHGMCCVLTGGSSEIEIEYGRRICELATTTPTNLIGKTNLKQLLAILERATVLISPDSGPAHMATAVGTPVIGLYVTSNPLRTGPYRDLKWVVNRYPDAVRREFNRDPDALKWGQRVRDPDSMSLITAPDVIDKLTKLMASLN